MEISYPRFTSYSCDLFESKDVFSLKYGNTHETLVSCLIKNEEVAMLGMGQRRYEMAMKIQVLNQKEFIAHVKILKKKIRYKSSFERRFIIYGV